MGMINKDFKLRNARTPVSGHLPVSGCLEAVGYRYACTGFRKVVKTNVVFEIVIFMAFWGCPMFYLFLQSFLVSNLRHKCS
jgi:hypothetical protein